MPPEWAFTVHEALQKAAEVILHARAAPAPLENDVLLGLEGEDGAPGYGPTIPPSPYHRVNSGGSTSGGGGGSRRSRVSLCVLAGIGPNHAVIDLTDASTRPGSLITRLHGTSTTNDDS